MKPMPTEFVVEILSLRDGAMSSLDSEGRKYDERQWGNCTVLDDKAPKSPDSFTTFSAS
jgi:hypothetical protein